MAMFQEFFQVKFSRQTEVGLAGWRLNFVCDRKCFCGPPDQTVVRARRKD
jgi:hypothetical protein